MTTRTHELAQPKPNRLILPDRRSVYWLDELPPERSRPTATELTPRWSELCRSTKRHTLVTSSPIWVVNQSALKAVASKRLCSLAQPRSPATGWEPERPLLFPLNRATQTAVASARVRKLAQPRRPSATDRTSGRDSASVARPACRASAHIELLSSPKHEHAEFRGERPALWPVSKAARSYKASDRLLDLSAPKERRALYEGFDPYTVSRAACSARPSPRLRELSLPLPRKCSSKSS